MTDFNIPSIILDPRNEDEVILSAYDRVRSASNGIINDFSLSSPIAALIEGQAFVQMELLWYLNQLPTALALEVFRLLGAAWPGSGSDSARYMWDDAEIPSSRCVGCCMG